jgi:hypothetical protein
MKALAEMLGKHEQDRIIEAAERVFPRVLPDHWSRRQTMLNGACWVSARGLAVIGEVEQVDGQLWIHVSVSRQSRLPDWADLRAAKNLFMGPERRAIQNLPPESQYYSLHPYCLHMYSPLDHEPIPDFRAHDGRL